MNRSFEVEVSETKYDNGRSYWTVVVTETADPSGWVREEYLQQSWTQGEAVMDSLIKLGLVEHIR